MLVRFGDAAREKPGVLDRENPIRDLSSVFPDIDPAAIGARLGGCIAGTHNFVAVGLNDADDAADPVPGALSR